MREREKSELRLWVEDFAAAIATVLLIGSLWFLLMIAQVLI